MGARARQLSMGHRYERRGLLAVDPKAFLHLFFLGDPPTDNEIVGDVEVLSVRGPLDQHDMSWCDSYEAITRRMAAACESASKAIVLKLDSPGGDAAGCLEAARALRKMAAAAGKPLYAYVDGTAASAAYALASAAREIVLGDTAVVGSIGVINVRDDMTAYDAARGVKFAIVTSGKRKADGNPHQPITEAELEAKQQMVDSLAGIFFELVAEHRPALSVEEIRALEAGQFHGQDAVDAGLADSIEPFDALLARASGGNDDMDPKATTTTTTGASTQASKYEDAKKLLQEAAEGDSEDAKKARKMLDAEDGDDAEGDDDDSDAEDAEDGDDAEGNDDDSDAEDAEDGDDAEGDDDEPADDKKDDDKKESKKAKAKAARVSAKTAGKFGKIAMRALAEAREAKAMLKKERRTALLASRQDLPKDLRKYLATRPLSEVKDVLAAMPRKKTEPAATATVGGTRGATQTSEGESRLPPDEARKLDIAMGIVKPQAKVVHEPHRMILGAPEFHTDSAAAEQAK